MSLYVRDYDSLSMRLMRLRNLVNDPATERDRAYLAGRRLHQLRQTAPSFVSTVRVVSA